MNPIAVIHGEKSHTRVWGLATIRPPKIAMARAKWPIRHRHGPGLRMPRTTARPRRDQPDLPIQPARPPVTAAGADGRKISATHPRSHLIPQARASKSRFCVLLISTGGTSSTMTVHTIMKIPERSTRQRKTDWCLASAIQMMGLGDDADGTPHQQGQPTKAPRHLPEIVGGLNRRLGNVDLHRWTNTSRPPRHILNRPS